MQNFLRQHKFDVKKDIIGFVKRLFKEKDSDPGFYER